MEKKISKKPFVLSTLALLTAYLIYGNKKVVTTRYKVESEKIEGGTVKILQISDFHNSKLGGQVVRIAKREKPDYIVITGDIINSGDTDTENAEELVKALVKEAPVYYVPGNHEARMDGYKSFEERLKKEGVTVLNDRSEVLKNNIVITGLRDPNFLKTIYIESSELIRWELEKIPVNDDAYNILLFHRPEEFEEYLNYDLVFSGHAHGGQFRIPFAGGLFAPGQGLFPKYDAGEYVSGKTHMIVSRGVGESIIPVRINNNPEVVICEIRGKKRGNTSEYLKY